MEIVIIYILVILLAISVIVQRKMTRDLMRLVDFLMFIEKDKLEKSKDEYIDYYEKQQSREKFIVIYGEAELMSLFYFCITERRLN